MHDKVLKSNNNFHTQCVHVGLRYFCGAAVLPNKLQRCPSVHRSRNSKTKRRRRTEIGANVQQYKSN